MSLSPKARRDFSHDCSSDSVSPKRGIRLTQQAMWWAVGDVAGRDMMVVLPQDEAEALLRQWESMFCRTWGDLRQTLSAGELEWLHELLDEEDPAEDDDPIDLRELGVVEDGDYPPAPESRMFYALPTGLVEWEDGPVEVMMTSINGWFAYIDANDRATVLRWLSDHGFRTEEHEELAVVLQGPDGWLYG